MSVLNARAVNGTRPAGGSSARYGFHLVEVAQQAGVDFVHEGPTFDSRLEHIMPQVAALGASVAVADFDRDGRGVPAGRAAYGGR